MTRMVDLKHSFLWLICLALILSSFHVESGDWRAMKSKLLEEIEQDMLLTREYTGKNRLSPHVMEAMAKVDRHRFVPEAYREEAWENHPLPIGEGQTISQPFIVALMTELLEIPDTKGMGQEVKILELGTGSGYQAAVLSELADEVFSIEVVASLADSAAKRLAALGYANIQVKHGDGTKGWPEEGPFDGIIVTAAGVDIPDALLQQLKPEACLVIPLGGEFETQQLMVIRRQKDGTFSKRTTLPVRFVPITSLPSSVND